MVAWSFSRIGLPGFESWQGKIFSFPQTSRPPAEPTRPTVQWVLGSLGIQQSVPEFNHSLPRGAEVKSGRSCTSLMSLRAVDSENFAFYSTQMKNISPSSGRVSAS